MCRDDDEERRAGRWLSANKTRHGMRLVLGRFYIYWQAANRATFTIHITPNYSIGGRG
jgi:hypothetical protein